MEVSRRASILLANRVHLNVGEGNSVGAIPPWLPCLAATKLVISLAPPSLGYALQIIPSHSLLGQARRLRDDGQHNRSLRN
jgi:hypothetical protein